MSGVNWPLPPRPNETVRQYLERYEETVEEYLARGGKIVHCPPPAEAEPLELRQPPRDRRPATLDELPPW